MQYRACHVWQLSGEKLFQQTSSRRENTTYLLVTRRSQRHYVDTISPIVLSTTTRIFTFGRVYMFYEWALEVTGCISIRHSQITLVLKTIVSALFNFSIGKLVIILESGAVVVLTNSTTSSVDGGCDNKAGILAAVTQ